MGTACDLSHGTMQTPAAWVGGDSGVEAAGGGGEMRKARWEGVRAPSRALEPLVHREVRVATVTPCALRRGGSKHPWPNRPTPPAPKASRVP